VYLGSLAALAPAAEAVVNMDPAEIVVPGSEAGGIFSRLLGKMALGNTKS